MYVIAMNVLQAGERTAEVLVRNGIEDGEQMGE